MGGDASAELPGRGDHHRRSREEDTELMHPAKRVLRSAQDDVGDSSSHVATTSSPDVGSKQASLDSRARGVAPVGFMWEFSVSGGFQAFDAACQDIIESSY